MGRSIFPHQVREMAFPREKKRLRYISGRGEFDEKSKIDAAFSAVRRRKNSNNRS
jgi:hypothetical protein